MSFLFLLLLRYGHLNSLIDFLRNIMEILIKFLFFILFLGFKWLRKFKSGFSWIFYSSLKQNKKKAYWNYPLMIVKLFYRIFYFEVHLLRLYPLKHSSPHLLFPLLHHPFHLPTSPSHYYCNSHWILLFLSYYLRSLLQNTLIDSNSDIILPRCCSYAVGCPPLLGFLRVLNGFFVMALRWKERNPSISEILIS